MMSASAFSKYAFERALRAGDSSRFGVDLKAHKSEEIAKAIAASTDLGALVDCEHPTIGGKPCVTYSDYQTTLVLRALASNIRYRTRVRMPNRDNIVRGVLQPQRGRCRR